MDASELTACLSDLADRPEPDPVSLARVVANKTVEKHDRHFRALLDDAHASRTFDFLGHETPYKLCVGERPEAHAPSDNAMTAWSEGGAVKV